MSLYKRRGIKFLYCEKQKNVIKEVFHAECLNGSDRAYRRLFCYKKAMASACYDSNRLRSVLAHGLFTVHIILQSSPVKAFMTLNLKTNTSGLKTKIKINRFKYE